MNIRMRQLQAFLSFVDCGSVTEAAKNLSLTQSSVSKLLASLEAEIGFLLFDRVGRKLKLTEQGVRFLPKARETIERVTEIRKAAEDIRDNQERHLRIAAIGPVLYSQLLPKAITKFSKTNPNYRFSVDMIVRIEIEEWVTKRHSDLGFTLLPIESNLLNFHPISSGDLVVALPIGHRLAQKRELTPEDVKDEHLIIPRAGVRVRGLIETSFADAGISLNAHTQTTTMISVVHLIASGLGIGIVDPYTVTGIDQSAIVTIPWRPSLRLTYGVVWPKSRKLAKIENDFIDMVEFVSKDLFA